MTEVRIDWLMASAANIRGPLEEKERDALVDLVASFLASGGRFSWMEWTSLTEEGRGICAEAGARVYGLDVPKESAP